MKAALVTPSWLACRHATLSSDSSVSVRSAASAAASSAVTASQGCDKTESSFTRSLIMRVSSHRLRTKRARKLGARVWNCTTEGETRPCCARSERGQRLRRMTHVRRATIPRDDCETIERCDVLHDVPKSGQTPISRRYPKNIVTNKNELLKGNYSYWNQPIRVFITASLLLSG